MARMMRMMLVVAVTVFVGSCVFFAAQSDFYVDNQSASDLTVSWTRVDGGSGEAAVAAGTRVMLMSQQLIETDMVLPSDIMTALVATVNGAAVYTQDPINDGLWERTAGSGSKDYVFDLVLTDADLP
jgi:hypothetical protein